jgi:hypothetical protein
MSDTNAEGIDDEERDIVRSTARFQKLKLILRLSVVTGAIVIKIVAVSTDNLFSMLPRSIACVASIVPKPDRWGG